MKIYISGKITGLPYEESFGQFDLVEKLFYDFGHWPINPMKLQHDHDQSWESYMRVDIAALTQCDAIYLLKNWHDSKGACLEHHLANYLGIAVYFEHFTSIEEIPLLKIA